MKLCKKCGEELEDTAKFCSKCGGPQTAETKEAANTSDDTAAAKKASGKVKKPSTELVLWQPPSPGKPVAFDNNIAVRQFFREAGKEKYTKQTAENVKNFLEAKKIGDLFPIAIIMLKELNLLYRQWEQAKKELEDDTMSFDKLGKLQKKLRAGEDKLLTQFEKAIEDLNEKEERKKEGKKKFNNFNEKKQRIYERLRESSPNDGSCDDKDCGYNNCLTLAMKIAADKDDFDSCPYVENDDNEYDSASFSENISQLVSGLNKLLSR
jgi:hypothetical protein